MLSGAGFCDDAFCTKPFRQQRLADRIVDLVCARVCEVFALEPDFGTPALAKPRCEGQCGWPPDPLTKLPLELCLEGCLVQVLLNPCSSRSNAGTSVSGT